MIPVCGFPIRSSTFSFAPVAATVRSKIFAMLVARVPFQGGVFSSPYTTASATSRPCLFAGPASGTTPTSPVIGFLNATASPMARIYGRLVWKCSSTRIAPAPGFPAGIVAIPASWASFVSGRIPTESRTMSVSIVSPEANRTRIRLSCFSKAFTPSRKRSSRPFSRKCRCTIAAISKSSGAITCSRASTMATFTPRCARFSAISRPIKPPPTTTARSGFSVSSHALMASASGTVRRVKIPSRSMPGIGGRIGSAPGERINSSYGS